MMPMLPTSAEAYKNPTCTPLFLPLNPSPNISLTFPLYNWHNLFTHTPYSNPTATSYHPYPMATSKLPATILILYFLLFTTFATACGPCQPKLPPKGPPAYPFCPLDTLKLGVCADLLGLVNVVIGDPPSGDKCCALLEGLVDLEVAACLCTAIKANVLGINLNVPIALSALVSACQKTIPSGFKCV